MPYYNVDYIATHSIMKGSNAKDILVNNSNKEMSEMQTKNQVEDSIIQESLLTCIDLANSDLHQSALLLKKVYIHLFLLLLFYFVRNQ